jgi:hypothetical protein
LGSSQDSILIFYFPQDEIVLSASDLKRNAGQITLAELPEFSKGFERMLPIKQRLSGRRNALDMVAIPNPNG